MGNTEEPYNGRVKQGDCAATNHIRSEHMGVIGVFTYWRPLARTIYELYDLLILLAVFPSLFGPRAGGGSRHLLFHNHHRAGRRVCGRRTIAAALHGSIHR